MENDNKEKETYLNEIRDFIQNEEEPEDEELDFLKDIPHIDPTVEQTRTMVQEEITKAMETLTDTDKDIFETTRLIHINRELDGETLVNHAINMQKIGNRKMDRRLFAAEFLILIGILLCTIGLAYKHFKPETPGNTANKVTETDPYIVSENEEPLPVSSENFPDEAFREWVSETADTDGNGKLSPDERNSVLIVLCSGNDKIASVEGIRYFPQLQGIDLSRTSITSLDTSENKKLQYVNVSSTSVSSLDFRENTDLTEINVKGCSSLTELLMPEPSAVTSAETGDTQIGCSLDSDHIYTACSIKE